MTFTARGDTRVTSGAVGESKQKGRTDARTCARARTRVHGIYSARRVYCAARVECDSRSALGGGVVAGIPGRVRRNGIRNRRNRNPACLESTRFLSVSLSAFLPSLSVSLPRLAENARSLSKERRVVDHRYGGVEARKWPTIGCRILFAGISRMALVARGITAGIGMCKGIEMMQVSTRQHRPITLLILSLVASSNRVCVSSVISAVFATAQVSQIVTPHKQTQRKTLPRVSIQRTLREIKKLINVLLKNGSRHLSLYQRLGLQLLDHPL